MTTFHGLTSTTPAEMLTMLTEFERSAEKQKARTRRARKGVGIGSDQAALGHRQADKDAQRLLDDFVLGFSNAFALGRDGVDSFDFLTGFHYVL